MHFHNHWQVPRKEHSISICLSMFGIFSFLCLVYLFARQMVKARSHSWLARSIWSIFWITTEKLIKSIIFLRIEISLERVSNRQRWKESIDVISIDEFLFMYFVHFLEFVKFFVNPVRLQALRFLKKFIDTSFCVYYIFC